MGGSNGGLLTDVNLPHHHTPRRCKRWWMPLAMLSDIITLYCICVSETSAAPKLPVPYSFTCIHTYYIHLERHIRRRADAVNGTRDCLSCLFLSVPHFIMTNTAKPWPIFPKQQLQIFHNELHLHMVTICATVYVNHPLETHLSSLAPPLLHWGKIWSKHPCAVLKISAELCCRTSPLSAFMKRLVHLHLAPIDQYKKKRVLWETMCPCIIAPWW